MEPTNTNPLAKYFRAPGVSLRLPSMGRFQTPDNVRFTATGEINVLPMRAADEMLLKSPDALMSGLAVEQVLKSCVPDLKDVKQLPSPDVDALLLAIRASTYGSEMTVESECPSCGHENAYAFDINSILDAIEPLAEEYPVRLSDEVMAYLRPFNFEGSTQISMLVFQETRKMQLLERDEGLTPDERQKQINTSFQRLNHMNIQLVADCVMKVVVPEATVIERAQVNEFIHNIGKEMFAKLEAQLKGINEAGVNKAHPVECVKCGHSWKAIVEFDPASFFGQGS
jgi:hypothetical protein